MVPATGLDKGTIARSYARNARTKVVPDPMPKPVFNEIGSIGRGAHQFGC